MQLNSRDSSNNFVDKSQSRHNSPIAPHPISAALRHVGRVAMRWLTAGNEPQVYQVKERSGVTQWVFSDPAMRSFVSRSSEQEIRAAIEERYYARSCQSDMFLMLKRR